MSICTCHLSVNKGTICDAGLGAKFGLIHFVCAYEIELALSTLRDIMWRFSLECHKPSLL